MRTLLTPALCVLALGACDQLPGAPEPEAETPPAVEAAEEEVVQVIEAPTPSNEVERKTATIDWNQARMDFASRESNDTGMVEVASGGSPVVPILLPEQSVSVASTGEDALQFRPLADGYFAVQKGEAYDLIVNGTDKLVVRPNGSGAAVDTPLTYEETMTGAQVSFSRYGASYLVEFMCKERETVLDGTCINETDALAEVENLLIAGTR